MSVWRVATTIVDLALFGQRGLLGEVVGAVQFGDVLRDRYTLCVHPRTRADTVPRVDRASALRRQVGVSCLCARTDRRREPLAMLVGASNSAEIGALARADTCHEERHIGLLRPRRRDTKNRETRR